MQIRQNLIGGGWHSSDEIGETRSPSDQSDIVGVYTLGTADDVDQAASVAAQAAQSWVATSPILRAELLERIAVGLERRESEIATTLSREEGKILADSAAETRRAVQVFRFFAGEALRTRGELIPSIRDSVDVEIAREPIGVVGLITPWNFPIAIPAWKAAPALAYGNTVLLKPAEQAPGAAHILAQIIHDAGAPAGVFNLVMGRGSVVGRAISKHPLVAGVSFTGSVAVGRELAQNCAAGLKRIQLEMGGKNPLLVLSDADISNAITVTLNGAFYQTGQRCTASSRIIVQADIHDAFIDQLKRRMLELRVGHALDHSSQIGPVASERQLESNLAYVRLAADEGCDVIGGDLLAHDKKGFYQSPALFLNAENAMRSASEEIFGPCASVIRCKDFEHGLEIANDTAFGLSSGICTSSLKSANAFKRRSSAGMVMVNLPTAGVDFHVPFGGRKGSSFGPREQGGYAKEFYTSVKTSYVFAG